VTDTDTELEQFLEHFGVKGMKWGIRHPAKKGDFAKRSGGQKAALIGGGVAGYYGVATVLAKVFGKTVSGRVKAPFTQVAISGVGAVAGARLTRNFLDRKGKTPVSSLPKISVAPVSKEPKVKKDHTKRNRIIIGGAAFGAGLAATSIILGHHGRVVASNLQIKHKDFVESHKLLHGKLKERMSDLRDLASQTSRGHPSHEGAMDEIQNLRTFYSARLSKLSSRYGIDAKTLKKMKIRSPV
jgi:hypothetical protein